MLIVATAFLSGCAATQSPSWLQPKNFAETFNQIPQGTKEVTLSVTVGGEVSDKNPAIATAIKNAFASAFEKRGVAVLHTQSKGTVEVRVLLLWEEHVWTSLFLVSNKFKLETRVIGDGERLLTDPVWSHGVGAVAYSVDGVAGNLASEVAGKVAQRF